MPVVPVAIKGAWQALPSGAWLPKPFAHIDVSYLAPIEPGGQSYDAMNQAVRERVAAAVG